MECHGEGAAGGGPLAGSLPVPPPNILDHLVHHTEEVLIRIAQTGIPPAMPPAGIGDEDARILFGYLESLLPPGVTIGSMGAMELPMGGTPMDYDNMNMPMGGPAGGVPGMPIGDSAVAPP
jgi:hypothetical protein